MASGISSGQKPTGVTDLDSVQTLENKTLDSSSSVNGAPITGSDIISPTRADVKKDTLANLQTYALTAANGQLCFATDAKKMYQVLDAALAEVGTGSGGINYIPNPDFELNADGWVGDTNLTIARSTSNPLRGDASGIVSKADTIDATGQVVKIPFTIDAADLAKKVHISADVDASDANYADGDLRWKIVKDPNGTPVTIRPNAEDILGGNFSRLAWFQSDATITEYELQIECNSANASAYSIKIDNVSVGPRDAVVGTSIDRSYYHIQQDGINMTDRSGEIEYALGSATITSEGSGITVEDDSANTRTKWIFNTKGNVNVFAGYRTANTNDTVQVLHYNSSGTLLSTLSGTKEGVSDGRQSSSFFLKVEPQDFITINSTQGVRNTANQCAVSISHDSTAAVIMSEDIGNREIRVRGAGNGGTSITANVTPIDFTEVEDTTASWDGSIFTAPETGDYHIVGKVSITSPSTYYPRMWTNRGGAGFSEERAIGDTSINGASKNFQTIVSLDKGDQVQIRSTNTITLSNDTSFHYIHIQKLAQPQTLLETETVAARYTSDSGQGMTTSATLLNYENKDFDTHNAYSAGIYTVPVTGYYHVIHEFGVASTATWSAGDSVVSMIFVDGAEKRRSFYRLTSSRDTTYTTQVHTTLYLEKGQTVSGRGLNSRSRSMISDEIYNEFSISRIK